MESEVLAKLRNVLAKLYPDEASMRRISHDAGLDLTRVALNSSATNNWHSVLIEAEKLGRVNALLTVVKQEYRSNQEFLDAYNAYHHSTSQTSRNADQAFTSDASGRNQINFFGPLGTWDEVRRSLFKEQARTSSGKALEERFQIFDWAKAEQAYLDKVVKLYDRIRILGNSVDVPLGNLFTQVYILDKPTARYRHDIEELHKRGHDRLDFQWQPGERIHGLDLVKTGQNLFILGKPGAGKTTFLKYITIQAARKLLPRIPIFVSLNQWADSRWGKGDKAALLPFLIEQVDICNFPDAALFVDYLLREGRVLILFDGLDEVKQEKDQHRRLTHLLQDFAHHYDRSQHLITCRIAASDYAFTGFVDVEVADFTPDQVREYAHKWFGEQDTKIDTFTTELARPENKGLAELCNTPLLLSMLCLTFDNTMRFPPNRAELYEDALETLLRKWDSSRQIQRDEIYRELSHKRKLQLLMNIAVSTFQRGELFFRQRDLEKWIVDYLSKLPGAPPADILDGTTLLKAIEAQHNILVERVQGIYSFSHLTFQEYLTARYLAENQGKEKIDNLIHAHLTDQRWREVFLLTTSLLDDADNFVTTLRTTTDGLLVDVPTLICLLTWAHDQTTAVRASVELRHAVELAYIFLDRAIAFIHASEREHERRLTVSFTRGLARSQSRLRSRFHSISVVRESAIAFAGARAIEQNRSIALANAITLALSLARESANKFENLTSRYLVRAIESEREPGSLSARSCALELARATAPSVGFDFGLYYAWAYANLFANEVFDLEYWQAPMQEFPSLLQVVAGLADDAKLAALAQYLRAMPMSLPRVDGYSWQQYAVALFPILRDERALRCEWKFSNKEIYKLNDYFYANELLVQCLKVAAVSNRDEVLQKLLLPPGVSK